MNEYFGKVNVLTDFALQRIEEIVDLLGLDLYFASNKLCGVCPIHEGADNPNAFVMNLDGEIPGLWRCHTHNCQVSYGRNFMSFIKAVLCKREDRAVKFGEAVKFIESFLGQSCQDIKVNVDQLERARFANTIERIADKKEKERVLPTREQIRQVLTIPAQYYLERGFSAKVLDDYDVGFYHVKNRALSNRIVFPIYDETNTYVIGGVGRVPHENWEEFNCPKWKNSDNLDRDSILYNYWKAHPIIKNTGVAVLVEGQGDCLKLVEGGVNNAVGMFGTAFTANQQSLLTKAGCFSLIIIPDNDTAGEDSTKIIREQVSRYFNVYEFGVTAKDVGEMDSARIRKEILPFVEEVERNVF